MGHILREFPEELLHNLLHHSCLKVSIFGQNITAAEGAGEKWHSSRDSLAGMLIQTVPVPAHGRGLLKSKKQPLTL